MTRLVKQLPRAEDRSSVAGSLAPWVRTRAGGGLACKRYRGRGWPLLEGASSNGGRKGVQKEFEVERDENNTSSRGFSHRTRTAGAGLIRGAGEIMLTGPGKRG